MVKGGGRCKVCDGPQASGWEQMGYCCRGDGYQSSCTAEYKTQMTIGGFKHHHACVYKTSKAVSATVAPTTPPTPPPTVAPSAEYIVGGSCWQMCPKNVMISGDGRCNNCNGPAGQLGYCCRADGYKSNCQSTFKTEVLAAGHTNQHRCIYAKYGKIYKLTPEDVFSW